MFTPTKMEFEKCFRPESSELKPWCFPLRKVWPKGSTWTMNPIPGCKDTGGRARRVLVEYPHNVPWFHKGSVRFRKKPQEFPVSLPVQLGPPLLHQHHCRTYCREPTFTPAPAADKFWRYADGTSPGTSGEAAGCQVSRDEVVTWIQTCFLFDKVGWRCEFYCRIFGYGGGHCFGNLTKKPDAACSLEAGKAAHENKVRWVRQIVPAHDPYWQRVFQPYTLTRDCSLKWRPVTFNGTS